MNKDYYLKNYGDLTLNGGQFSELLFKDFTLRRLVIWDMIAKDTQFVKIIFKDVTFTDAAVQNLTMKNTAVGKVFNNKEHRLLYEVIKGCEKECCKGPCSTEAYTDKLIGKCFTACKAKAAIPPIDAFLTGTKVEAQAQKTYTPNDLAGFKKQLEEIKRQKEAKRLQNTQRIKSIKETRLEIAAKLDKVGAEKKAADKIRDTNQAKNTKSEADIKALQDKLDKSKETDTAQEKAKTDKIRAQMKALTGETSKLEEAQKSLKLNIGAYDQLVGQQKKLGGEAKLLQEKLAKQEAQKKQLLKQKKSLQAKEKAQKVAIAAKLQIEKAQEEAKLKAKGAKKTAAQTSEEAAKVKAAKEVLKKQIAVANAKETEIKKSIKKIKLLPESDTYFSGQKDIGTYGGIYTCPNGTPYPVGDNKDDCYSLAGSGGKAGPCNKKTGIWSNKKVVCNSGAALNKAAIEVKEKKLKILKAKLQLKEKNLNDLAGNKEKQDKAEVEARFAQKLAQEKEKLRLDFASKLDKNKKTSDRLEKHYKSALSAQTDALAKSEKVAQKLKYVGQIVKLKKEVETAIKNDDEAKTKMLQKKVNEVADKLAVIEKANADKETALKKAKAELAKLKASAGGPPANLRILASGFTATEQATIKKLGTELHEYKQKIAQTKRLETLQKNLLRQRLADSYAKDFLPSVYIKEIKIASTKMYNIHVSNLEVLIPVVEQSFVQKTIDGSNKDVQKKIDMPAWKTKVWPYKIILPTKKQDGKLSDNLYRWPQYDFKRVALVYGRNRGKY